MPSSACGCCGFLNRVAGEQGTQNVVVGDYISLEGQGFSGDPREIGFVQRNQLETLRSESLAWEIMGRLPQSDADREALLNSGYALAEQMSWEAVCRDYFLPGIERAVGRREGNV